MSIYRRRESGGELLITAAVYAGIFGALSLGAFGCAKIAQEPDSKVEEFVSDAGYLEPEVVDVDILGIQFTGCGENDLVGYDVEAISATTGREVNLKVCDGLFKGMTIRSND